MVPSPHLVAPALQGWKGEAPRRVWRSFGHGSLDEAPAAGPPLWHEQRLGIIIALIGLSAFGGFARGRWY